MFSGRKVLQLQFDDLSIWKDAKKYSEKWACFKYEEYSPLTEYLIAQAEITLIYNNNTARWNWKCPFCYESESEIFIRNKRDNFHFEHKCNKKEDKYYIVIPRFGITEEWGKLAKKVREELGNFCLCCGAIPSEVKRIEIDHIRDKTTFPELAFDFDNLQPLCKECHSSIEKDEYKDWRQKTKKTISQFRIDYIEERLSDLVKLIRDYKEYGT